MPRGGPERFALDGAVAVVTGAGGKLGPVWIRALLDAGATVAALDRPGAAPSPGFADLSASVPADRLRAYACDVTDRAALDACRDTIVGELGEPSVLVNNAGIDQPPDSGSNRFAIEDVPVDLFKRVIDVNLTGTFQATQSFGVLMVARRRGSIVNIGSLYASVSPDPFFYEHFPGEPPFLKLPAYGASKAGVVNLTKFFAAHWGRHNVRVNTLSPGGVLAAQDDEFQRKYGRRVPLGRMAQADDLAGPLVFLASAASSYVSGHELRVDGGFTAW